MSRLLFCLLAATAVISRGDEAVNKLVAGRDQALRALAVPIHRKLLTELQKLEAQYTKAGQKIPLAETQAEIARVKQQITDSSQPAGSGAGPQPSDFKLVYSSSSPFVLGSWENGELKALPKGFAWTNKSQKAGLTYTSVLKGAFEAEFTWKGSVYTASLTEADYTKYVHYYTPIPPGDAKHTLKVKRTAAGAISGELDGNPVTLIANEGARPDMYMRFTFYVDTGATVEFREAIIKDFSAKK